MSIVGLCIVATMVIVSFDMTALARGCSGSKTTASERNQRVIILNGRVVMDNSNGPGAAGDAGHAVARIPRGYTKISRDGVVIEHWTELYIADGDGFVRHWGNEHDDSTFESTEAEPSLNEIGERSLKAGKWMDSVRSYGRALAIGQAILGQGHPGLLNIMKPYLSALRNTNMKDEAKKIEVDIASIKLN